jgi:hypothetical protein
MGVSFLRKLNKQLCSFSKLTTDTKIFLEDGVKYQMIGVIFRNKGFLK